MRRRQLQSLATAFVAFTCLVALVTVNQSWPNWPSSNQGEGDVYRENRIVDTISVDDRLSKRLSLLNEKCRQYTDPFRPEYSALSAIPQSLGVEVVYLHGGRNRKSTKLKSTKSPKVASVCIPHKVGSYSWGQFARNLTSPSASAWLSLDWKTRAEKSLRVVVVRHPLTRILSVYRMIFEDWCDRSRFLAKQWGNAVCDEKNFAEDSSGIASETRSLLNLNYENDFSAADFFASLVDEHFRGNDRFIVKIWQKLHPDEKLVNPRTQLKFTFREFVHFLVNGSRIFSTTTTTTTDAGDVTTEMTVPSSVDNLNYNRLSYHWAPYWRECSLCSDLTRPHFILHMETLQEDLNFLLQKLDLPPTEFPLTHTQKGGHSSSEDVFKKYYSTLLKSDVRQLYEMYRLDHELFGYSPEKFESYAQ